MYNLKKYIIQFATIFILFLSPFSLTLNTYQSVDTNVSISPLVEVNMNTAYALSVPCKGGWMNFIDNTACGIGNIILTYFELIWFYTTQILAVLAGLMLDFFLFFSIDSQFYRSGMIEAGWEILRNFTNILFIFALLVSAFKMVLGVGSADAKKKLIHTILIALVINFSLFVSYAVIDSSNIFAHIFYNKIESGKAESYKNVNGTIESNSTGISVSGSLDNTNPKPEGVISENQGGNEIVELTEKFLGKTGSDTRSISLGVMSNINPQRMITNARIDNFGQAFITVVMSGLMNILLIYLFISITILFVGRTLGLMILAILSPLAFSSILIPSLENNKYIGLKNWFSQLISLSFMAPIFIFFMYLTVTFISNDGVLASLNSHNDSFFGRIMSVYMLFFMIGGMLWFARKITKDMAGEIGDLFGKAVAGATGAIVGVGAMAVTGGAAMAGGITSGIGRASSVAGKVFKSKKLVSFGNKTRNVGRLAMSAKMDVTKLPGFKHIVGKDATNAIKSVTGRSALGHIDNTDSFEESEKKRLTTNQKWKKRTDTWSNSDGFIDKLKNTVKEESGYNKAKEWQDKIIDEESKSDVKRAQKEILNLASGEQDANGNDITNKELIQGFRDAFSKGMAVKVDVNGAPLQANISPDVTAITGATHLTKDGTANGTPVSEVEFQEIIVKKLDKKEKTAETELKKANKELDRLISAGASQAEINNAEYRVQDREDKHNDVKTAKENFEKNTLKKGKEKAEMIEKSITGRAKEKVAQEHEDNGNVEAARRIRNGKVKIEDIETKK